MELNVFCEKIRCALQEYLGNEVTASIAQIPKNNGVVLQGLLIRSQNARVSPTIYLNPLYDRYLEGMAIQEVVKEIIDSWEHNKGENIDMEYFTEFAKVSNRIIYKLVNYTLNETMLSEIPHIRWNDLALVFCHLVDHDDVGSATVLIRKEHIKMWGVDLDEIYRCARINTPSLMGEELIPINDILHFDMLDEMDMGMYVLSNTRKLFGAAALLYSENVKKLADKFECGLYIIPSSIHELILIPETCMNDVACMRQMIREVNDTTLSPEERLADTLYYYDLQKDEVRIAA